MNARPPTRAALFLLASAVALTLIATPSTANAAGASLRVTPGSGYVAGQSVTFAGNIGLNGVRSVKLQTNMNRGGPWTDLEGRFRAKTDSNGNFEFQFPAPSMRNIMFRVASGGAATPGFTFDPKSQDLVLDVDLGDSDAVTPGLPFDIAVDTTPEGDDVKRRPDLEGTPAFPGRTLTLQQRDGEGWDTLATTSTDQRGNGLFRNVTVDSTTLDNPGEVVYRARQENYTQNGHDIGWFPSFPTYVDVIAPGGSGISATDPAPAATVPQASPTSDPTLRASESGGATSASKANRWGVALWDFAWVFGESLSSQPYRGLDRKGRWLDSSDGTGRVMQHNGGVMLDSKRVNDAGPGDRGTTRATLRGNPMRYGRWEVNLRLKSEESNARDYSAKLELVPENPGDYRCGAQNITIADVSAHDSSLTVGAKALKKSREWTRTVPGVFRQNGAYAFAVEVTRRHITWFMQGKAVATVRSRAATPRVPMTLRMSLEGDGQQEMNQTQMFSDWQRGFSLKRGKSVKNGPRMSAGRHSGGC